jgi:2-dehydropantoate 2-reductase
MKIAIVGTGAMGSLFAALLARFADIVMVGSWSEQLLAVREEGLILRHVDGQESRHVIRATTRGADAAPAELAIVAVKGWQTERAARLAQKALSPSGLALTLQNGLGNLETIGAVVGPARVAVGVTSEGATMLGAGVVHHAGNGHTYFAATENMRTRLEQTAALFNQAGLPATVVEDAQSLIWGKLAVNAGINPLTALLQVPNGYLIQDARAFDIMGRAADEAAAVATKLGIKLPFTSAASRAAEVARATANNRSSMAQDIARGMPTEIEQISGAIVRQGRSVVAQSPVNEALLLLVRAKLKEGSWSTAVGDLPADLQPIFRDLSTLETAS